MNFTAPIIPAPEFWTGDALACLELVASNSIDCIVTSPPYWNLRDYGVAGQIGLEPTMAEYLTTMVAVCRELRRVLKPGGTMFLNVGDSYFGGGRGGNPIESSHQKQRTNRGSVSMPVGGRHEFSYGRSGKVQEDYRRRDCFCQSLCDACREAYRIGRVHTAHSLVSRQDVSMQESSLDRIESLFVLPPMSGSPNQDVRSSDAKLNSLPVEDLFGEPLRDVQESSSLLSSLPHQAEHSHCGICASDLSTRRKYSPCASQKTVCICDNAPLVGASSLSRSGNSFLDSAYLRSTTPILKSKDLCMIPNRLAIMLQDDGWWVRSEIIWAKPNPMPESVTDRPTNCHEKIWLLTKSAKYHYDAAAIRNPPSAAFLREVADGYAGNATKDFVAGGAQQASATKSRIIEKAREKIDKQRGHGRRHAGFNDRWNTLSKDEQMALGSNARNVWTISPKPFKGAHFATFPPDLVERCILAGCPPGGLVLDPFSGSGTVALVAVRLGRRSLNFEINPDYVAMARERVAAARPLQSR